MSDVVEPQLGLRRRRRAIPDDEDAMNLNPNMNPNMDMNIPQEDDDNAAELAFLNFLPPRRVRSISPLPAPSVPVPQQSPSDGTGAATNSANTNTSPSSSRSSGSGSSTRRWKVSRVYCLISTLLAVLAIVVVASPAPGLTTLDHSHSSSVKSSNSNLNSNSLPWTTTTSVEQVANAAAVGVAASKKNNHKEDPEVARYLLQSIQQWWNQYQHAQQQQQQQQQSLVVEPEENRPLWWFRTGSYSSKTNKEEALPVQPPPPPPQSMRQLWNINAWIDPALLDPSETTPTDIIDKILTSTPRLLAIANFLLAMTYLLHSAVAAWFLGNANGANNAQQQSSSSSSPSRFQSTNNSNNTASPHSNVVDWSSHSAGARERMGGFLVFKLLLISAVVAPDTLDLLILLTWYTMLSCLRSLDHLAHATTTHLAALGQPPWPGVVQLLLLVLVSDILAAASCVALFHAAGWGMVLLLTCDCALLASDVLSHILKHFQCVLEDAHSSAIQRLEARQLELHNHNSNNNYNNTAATAQQEPQPSNNEEAFEHVQAGGEPIESDNNRFDGDNDEHEAHHADAHATMMTMMLSPEQIQQESRRLDRQMEVLDLAHARRLNILDSAMFTLELLCHFLTVAHFCHIWSLHGVQFTLIDGVLALHLHSAISSACRKIAQRRNIHNIARDLQGLFPNASDQELRKASLAGDVCCICLGTMSTGGHVKKVHCGHLYHTHCLREVVERAQSMQAAKCPLCRASVVDGRRPGEDAETSRRNTPLQPPAQPTAPPANDPTQNPPPAQQQPMAAVGEHALFRFSTEGIFPTWLPIPAFSFEVVRRPSAPVQAQQQQQPAAPTAAPQQTQQPHPQEEEEEEQLAEETDTNRGEFGVDNPEPQQQQPAQPQGQPSFLRRILILAGAIPMSPEEEARALAQLVDMFPQYDRSDLLRELRERGSSETVAESILMGIFSGVPRGDGE